MDLNERMTSNQYLLVEKVLWVALEAETGAVSEGGEVGARSRTALKELLHFRLDSLTKYFPEVIPVL